MSITNTPKALNTKAGGSAQRNPRLVIITIENPEETVEKVFLKIIGFSAMISSYLFQE